MDINVTVTLTAPALTDAILALVGRTSTHHPSIPSAATPAPTYPQPITPPVMAAPVSAPPLTAPTAPAYAAAPVQVTMAPPPAPVPITAAPAYTLEVLANAAAGLMSTGKQPELLALLGQFGAQSMSQLKVEQYGAFATALRQMGGKI